MKKNSFIAMSTVLVLFVVIVSLSVTVTIISVGEGQSSLAVYQSETKRNLIESCIDDALMRLQRSSGYNGGAVNLPEGSCTITVSSAGSTYTITAVPQTTSDYGRSIQTVVTRGSSIVVSSWKDL